jgi:hypothetical protein
LRRQFEVSLKEKIEMTRHNNPMRILCWI